MRRVAWLAFSVLLVATIGSAQAGRNAVDPIVADWKAKETCGGGACDPVYGAVRVTATGANTFVATVTETMYLMGDTACTHEGGKQVWQIRRVGENRYEGTADQFSSDRSWNCQHVSYAAEWSLTGRNKLSFSTPAWRRTHVFERSPLVDETPPAVRAYPTSAAPGTVARLPFEVTDDSGRASVTITIRYGSKTWSTGPGMRAAKGERQTFGWPVPTGVTGSFQFCVRATDEAGNASPEACSTVTLGGTERPAGTDRVAPVVRTRGFIGPRSAVILRWWAKEASGRASFMVVVYRERTVLAQRLYKNVAVEPRGHWFSVRYRPPAAAPRWLQFCVQGVDAAGNRSPISCAKLKLL